MKLLVKYMSALAILIGLTACSSDDKDETRPTITVNYENGFPQSCSELKRGETYNFRALVSDNEALASYSIEIHNNFDHHTHDDQEGTCEHEDEKDPVNPLIYMESFSIEGAKTEYEIKIPITIPADADTGDYHCAYSVIDQAGWQTRTSVDIKIVD